MTVRLNYNPSSVLTHVNLINSDRKMERVLDKLSSGERIRRTADDPAGLVVANAVRYYRRGVERAESNAEEAVTMLQTAEGGMDQIATILQRMRSLAVAAASTATQDPDQLGALQDDLDAAVRAITTVAQQTTYGGISLLDGSLRDVTLSDDAQTEYSKLALDWSQLPGGIQDGSAISIFPAGGSMGRTFATQAIGAGTPGDTLIDPAFGTAGDVTITGPKGSTTITIDATSTIASFVSAVAAASSITGVIAAYDQSTGDITLENTNFGDSPLTITSTSAGFFDAIAPTQGNNELIQVDYIDGSGAPQSIQLTQDPASPGGLSFTNVDGSPAVPPYLIYGPGAFTLTVKDTSDGGIGALIQPAAATRAATRAGTTAVQIGALSSQRVTIEIPDLRGGSLGISAGLAASGFGSLADLTTNGALTNGNANEALAVIDAAIGEVNRARGATGSLQGNTVERVMDSLRVSSQNLRQFESILRDVDMAEESAEFARIQVMLQAATAMLAQANQVPQTVLQLLR